MSNDENNQSNRADDQPTTGAPFSESDPAEMAGTGERSSGDQDPMTIGFATSDSRRQVTAWGETPQADVEEDPGSFDTEEGRTDEDAQSSSLIEQVLHNAATFGELTLHYPERDVVVTLDGASASRVMAAHAGIGTNRELGDPLVPLLAKMTNIWCTINTTRALAMTWMPDTSSIAAGHEDIMTIDPPPPSR